MEKRLPRNSRLLLLILWGTIIVFFSSLVFLSFYNHPSADDYFLGYHLREEGFIAFQRNIYLHWGGRYFSTFIASVFGYHAFLFSHYYLPTIFILLVNILAAFFLITTFNKIYFQRLLSGSTALLASFIVLLTAITCYPEPSTALYWFSSAATYQLSAALLLFAIAMAARVMNTPGKPRIIEVLLLLITVPAVNGTNEIAAMGLGFILLLLVATQKKQAVSEKMITILVVAAFYIISFLVLSMAPGNRDRLAAFDKGSITTAFVVSAARTGYIFWNIFQSPLSWIAGIAIYLFALFVREKRDSAPIALSNKGILIVLLILLGNIFIIHLPLLYFSNGSLPERGSNLLVFIAFGELLTAIFYFGVHSSGKWLIPFTIQPKTFYAIAIAVAIGIVCNGTSKAIFTSILSGRLYDRVMTVREQALQKSTGATRATIADYPASQAAIYQQLYPNGTREVIKQIVLQKPSLLFVFDDLENAQSITILKKYYQVDTLVLRTQTIPIP